MKKFLLSLIAVLMLISFASCGGGNAEETTVPSDAPTTQTVSDTVSINIKRELVADEKTFLSEMEDYKAVRKDTEDSIFYVFEMSQEDYQTMLDKKHAEVVDAYKAIEENKESYIEKIEYDEHFRNMRFYVNKDMYDATSSTIAEYGVAAQALAYQMYLPNGQKTTVGIIYSGTETVVTGFTLPINAEIVE